MAKKREQRIYTFYDGSKGVIVRVGGSDDGKLAMVRRPGAAVFLIKSREWDKLPVNGPAVQREGEA
jgi:hypothetical protein